MAMTKIKGLQQWCRRMTDGYAHVDVANFTTAWRDGMAFCAIIHRFRPDLIDYDSLSPENVYDNCKLAFEVAEKELDIPAFLEAEDMARLKVPDKLSVITYVSQYYNFLNALPQLGGPGVKGKVIAKSPTKGKRPPDIDTSLAPSIKKPATGEEGKENVSTGVQKTKQGSLGDKCNICQNRVYLLERHIEAGKLYHRSCFRHSELSPTNKVYTRSPFLSPSLSGETPPLSPSHIHMSTSNAEHHQHRTPGSHHHHHAASSSSKMEAGTGQGHSESGGKKSLAPFSLVSASSSSPRKMDGTATKHSLAQSDREDTKKSKLQVKPNSREEQQQQQQQKANAVKDRLKNLKEKYEVAKKEHDSASDGKKLESPSHAAAAKDKQKSSGAFPLSGKESRQLEKRREQILSAEKCAEQQSTRAGTRNVPLILQQKEADPKTQSSSASHVLSSGKQITPPASTSSSFQSSVSSTSSSSIITNTPTSSKTSITLDTDKPEKKTPRKIVKAEFVPKKEEVLETKKSLPDQKKSEKDQRSAANSTVLEVKHREKTDITSLQKKFSAPEDAGASKPSPHPVAKVRTHKPSGMATCDNGEAATTPILRAAEPKTSSTPKAAPRKSLIEITSEKKVPPERPKLSPSADKTLTQKTPPTSARSSGSESPPPLPETAPPPLPNSPAPSLPSAVIKVDTTSPRSSSSVQVARTRQGPEAKDPGNQEVTTHGPVQSRVAVSTEAVAKTSSKRWSSPAIHDQPLTVHGSLQVKDKGEQQVLTGLLASLAGVRGRAGSVPGTSAQLSLPATTASLSSQTSPPPPSSSPSSSAPTPASKVSSINIPTDKGSAGAKDCKTSTAVHPVPKKTADIANKCQGSPAVKTSESLKPASNGPRPVSSTADKLPEALSVLNSLKKVGGDHITTSGGSTKIEIGSHTASSKPGQKNFLTASRENLTQISTKPTSSKTKTENHPGDSAGKLGQKNFLTVSRENLNQTSTKPTLDESKQTETDANFNTIKLKPVVPDQRKNDGKSTAVPAFNLQLKKIQSSHENKESNSPYPQKALSRSIENLDDVKSSKDSMEKNSDKSVNDKSGQRQTSAVQGHKTQEKTDKSVNDKSGQRQTSASQEHKTQGKKTRKHSYEEDDLPDWKAALEERKKKLIARCADSPGYQETKPEELSAAHKAAADSAVDRDQTTHGDVPARSKEEKKSDDASKKDLLASKTKAQRSKSRSPHRTTKAVEKSAGVSVISADTPDKNAKTDLNVKETKKSSDWMHDAEMKIAALGGFESEEEEQVPQRPKRRLPVVPSVATAELEPKATQKSKVNADDDSKGKDLVKITSSEGELRSKKPDRESEPEFLTGKAKLKHVDGSEESKFKQRAEKEKDMPVSPVKKEGGREDFREKLHNLKHVQAAGEGVSLSTLQADVVPEISDKSKPSVQVSQTPQEVRKLLTRPLSLGDNGQNTNNNRSMSQLDKPNLTKVKAKSLLETVNLSSSPEVSDEEFKNKKNNSQQRHSTPILENGKVSPKVKKKKILFFGKNKKDKSNSPAESPIVVKKKIEAPEHIDFDQSSELESSLPDATARLTIEDKKTPPQRPPPPQQGQQKVMSPKHISAIELQQQLLEIDSRLTDLELRGRDLEDSIRNVNVLEEDDDSLMMKWFELVSEKNDLVRQEADLVYMSREQDLETEQEHIESQLRYLMNKSDMEKSSAEMEEEEYLIQRKLELVEQRNRIVDSMDEDRLRYEEEDRDIEVTLRGKGLWKDGNGTLLALKGKKVSRSTFYM
ncbi:mical-like 1 [Plakobranchus ocellatus]|uniref:Mical-like 1 n=1 Tax=Plakobranchus ocellatus TaxID=259542 RepID=A0AAV4BX59_9GAST|nr:mical-like 1 [Plakobranchus ocellatus]